MGRKKITIEDIAREANVGIGTVSRVLNNSSHVAEDTRKRVLDVVKARQYSPSGAASRLARNDAIESTVGLLLPDIGNHYFFEIFETIYRKFRGLGVDLLIFNYEKHNPQFIQKVLGAQLSALLIFAFQLDETERELLRRRNVPYLYIDYSRDDEHCMYTDNEQGGRLAARYLLSKGVKHPGYIAMDPPGQTNTDRHTGFISELALYGYKECALYNSEISEEMGYQIGMQIIDEQTCDGVFCYCDDIAVGVYKAVRERGSSIRIIGFDGVRATEHLGISTVSQEPGAIGTQAASFIVNLMEAHQERQPIHHRIIPVLVDRNS
ncbi:MAG: LacI family DNA-binding transcriptional regulator [Sphaerochaeta sp.]|uniref:LacI family DNA-binding transcriptional regulator n=1 Tax=Sphaerochaeta sp. S2 TaxID=2798868 RepID=UPI0018EA0674|nr:LacI family DNA-binding transcriptional regulator [Sphaerochaeta sp. S2]MCK9348409.1 LacI family transcriptional regulator [Sphaerochaeta sp.]MBJ2356909.1 LacI family DNA-binding transcriptional regulator [Sphaerochaeta sp. S2]MDD4301795.1 LacI family DNA-binding transcriptional regulator [Sphaerochaeta sp.]MDD4647832.1 LacI family DNA-binding transcriptional regulator [Sphaerochaeta sp.]MDY0243614.1 LacI family DNA-binding transcriptional regulator [Sphaerochaeta sp.]